MAVRNVPLSREDLAEMTPADLAAHKGNLEDLKKQTRDFPVDTRFRLLWYAARAGQVHIMKFLTSYGYFSGLLPAIDLTRTYRGDTPLHAAARKAQKAAIDFVKDIPHLHCRHTLNINLLNEKGQTPLLVASMEKDSIPEETRIETVKQLLNAGAFPDFPDKEGNTPRITWKERGWNISAELTPAIALLQSIAMGNLKEFSKALEKIGHLKMQNPLEAIVVSSINFETKVAMIQSLAEKFPRELKEHNGYTALLLAAEKGELEITEVLLANGANPTLSVCGDTPLHVVRSSELVSLLVPPCNIEAQDSLGRTPLHIAVEKGRMRVIRTLLELGADPNAQDKMKNTPLHHAPTAECAELLFGSGKVSSVDVQNIENRTPLHEIIKRASDPELASRDTRFLVRALLDRKPNLTLKTDLGTPLAYAKFCLKHAKDPEVIQSLNAIIQLLEPLTPKERSWWPF